MQKRTHGKKFENRSSERTDAGIYRESAWNQAKRSACRKENIGNSISGDATSRTPEYISSSHREWEDGRWREHGCGETVKRLWGLLRDSFVTFPSRFQQLPPNLSLSSGFLPTIFSQFCFDAEPNLLNLLCPTALCVLSFLSSHFIYFLLNLFTHNLIK